MKPPTHLDRFNQQLDRLSESFDCIEERTGKKGMIGLFVVTQLFPIQWVLIPLLMPLIILSAIATAVKEFFTAPATHPSAPDSLKSPD